MRDLAERQAQREGEVNIAELLRRSLDPDRVRELIAQAAALGHEEAEHWREELGLDALEPPKEPHEWLKPLGDRVLRLYACDCAERVLYIYERQFPDDSRPREAIEAARRYARGEISAELLAEAHDAGWLAARYAAWDAAYAVAYASARAAAWAAAEEDADPAEGAAWAAFAARAAAGAAAGDAAGDAARAAAGDAETAAQRRIAAGYLWQAIEGAQ